MTETRTTPQPDRTPSRAAVVTGASSGIGRATAARLAADGWTVFAVARRAERLESLAAAVPAGTGRIVPLPADVTDAAQVAAVRDRVAELGGADTVLCIAGGALGTDRVAEGRLGDWEWMYRVNVQGTLTTLQAFLPMVRATGRGTVLVLTSTAALASYEGGAGYNAAKMGQHGLVGALRLEEAEHGVRVVEVLPGMVHTEEFTRNRLRGDQAAADRVYAGVEEPLTAEDVADVCAYAVGLPHHVNLDQVVLRPVAQAAQHKVIRAGR
ncbi:SDR family oxidoreductase [Citricoccus sp. SGAir0253]|uniref:SDR family oxidoreductase n=1 Tax=Citricoccus sp. SGAir0253 TaxID=2567881 RepID=UPI0010CCCC86|nr:SDR family oxidoreductase [Citricoccus sp. SGAir0253]QCU78275.1 SDR family oxidoreductase [Citricoccus sp. SGAir0253]